MRMRRDPPQCARVEPAAAGGEEEGVLGAARELGPGVEQVAREPPGRLLAERDDPLLATFAPHADELLLEVDVRKIEVDGLAAAQPGRIEELHQRTVAQRERAVAVECLERLL